MTVYVDSFTSYNILRTRWRHEVVDHMAIEFVRVEFHTNGIENFWSLFKRCMKGTYISILPCHLDSYLDEEVFRFSKRKTRDADRFKTVVSQVSGKRILYEELVARGDDELLRKAFQDAVVIHVRTDPVPNHDPIPLER